MDLTIKNLKQINMFNGEYKPKHIVLDFKNDDDYEQFLFLIDKYVLSSAFEKARNVK
ncbi:MAG: hypothetical protein J6U54_17330 [Clostridiales bacterium]|nr:hypothetical protein [Clostridiales bacterium]